ncbi:hypothetical protein B0J18DRAFT_360459 [Chaetomium sp. MPI-SDFR-AT-0129]|nr:hypothetical protein B0J18DRAFT_360459 [Chaetomium sp. MPI-SDFR-AT-0129]
MASRDFQPGDGPLESRLRSMILSGPDNAARQQYTQNTGRYPPLQPAPTQEQQNNVPGSPSMDENGLSLPKSSRKRPNQAQRRQMSAQLSIPVDTRPQFPDFQSQHQTQHQNQYQNQRAQQPFGRGGYRGGRQPPHSATFRPPSRDNPPHERGGNHHRGSFRNGPRHQTSLSYHGPNPTAQQQGWPQSPRYGYQNPDMQYQMPGVPPQAPGPGMPAMPAAPQSMHRRQGSSEFSGLKRRPSLGPEELEAADDFLGGLCNTIVAAAEIEPAEIAEKENFRLRIEQVARGVIAEYERTQNGFTDFPAESVQLKCFGSLASGFATKASDMDLGILSPLSRVPPDTPGSPIPRLIEKAFLDMGLGVRLLTRTRVPIIKICEKPSESLRRSLLAEREKWERGVVQDVAEDEVVDGAEPQSTELVEPGELDHANRDAQAQDSHAPLEDTRLQDLKQETTLHSYYNFTKSLMRKLGLRELAPTNLNQFTADNIRRLNELNLAFVEGLENKTVRDRLLASRSLNRDELLSEGDHPHPRTLTGVFNQVEGEHLAALWEVRPFSESSAAREAAAENHVRTWRALVETPNYGLDPPLFQKELQSAYLNLKGIASLQILALTQGYKESAAGYCARALKLFYEVGGQHPRQRADIILKVLIENYINGILDEGIRERLREFQQTHRVTLMRAIGNRHKSLQLAHDYESALEKGAFHEHVAAQVRRYVEILNAPIPPSTTTQDFSRGIIPISPELAPLVAEMRALGDPLQQVLGQSRPRDRYSGGLEFPKSGVGVQCDLNFSAHLGVQNTLLLRCYAHCDPRLRPLVLFVKHWAKVRHINTPYRGTLGSYGYVLMMLHYLVNVAQPFVLPNLQQLARPPPPNLTPQQIEETVRCKGWDIQFWRDEAEIIRLARDNALTQNRESVGQLLRGFFEYYAKGGGSMSLLPCRSFDWGREVLSLRTHGGLLTKHEKGWVGAKTVIEVQSTAPPASPSSNPPVVLSTGHTDPTQPPQIQQQQQPQAQTQAQTQTKEIRNRYLFAIEDPFELDHNIARTVVHTGIVSIRDEFRRAWRLIKLAGKTARSASPGPGPQGQGQQRHQGLAQGQDTEQEKLARLASLQAQFLQDAGGGGDGAQGREAFGRLLDEIHGVGGEGEVVNE